MRFLLRLFLTVVVRHGDDGQDEVDQVERDEVDQIERAEKDDHDEEEHVIQAVGTNNLTIIHAFYSVVIVKCTIHKLKYITVLRMSLGACVRDS